MRQCCKPRALSLIGGLLGLLGLLPLSVHAQPIQSADATNDGYGTRLTPLLKLQMAGVGQPLVSPDGAQAVYPVAELDPDGKDRTTSLWLLDCNTGVTRRLTRGATAGSPLWDPDGQGLYFLRASQVWWLSLSGGEPEQITNIPGGVDGFALNPDPGGWPHAAMAVSREVHPGCTATDWDCTQRARQRWEERPGLVTELFPLRHWMSWRDSLETHILLGDPVAGHWVDLTAAPAPRPPFALASGAKFSFAPDGLRMAIIRNPEPDVALSTNNNIYILDLTDLFRRADGIVSGSGTPAATGGRSSIWDSATLLSTGLSGGGGNDDQPSFSPDGRFVAYTSMRRPGYESDLREIMLHDLWTGAEQCLTCGLNRSARSPTWSCDSCFLYFTAYDREASALYRIEVASGAIDRLLRAGSVGGLAPLPDGRLLLLLESSRMPEEVFVCDPQALARHAERWGGDLAPSADGQWGNPGEAAVAHEMPLRQLTFHNWERLRPLKMTRPEHFWFTGAQGDSVHGIFLSPPGHDGSSPVPLVLVLHGGPQWAYHDFWLRSYNFQMIAAAGYAVATVNFHGSAGYGIRFQDAIRGHWGDVPGEDVEHGLNYIQSHYTYIDTTRMAAIGRSFGGYLVNWLNGHSSRFRCMVAHSGGFDETSGWGTTEELWFPEWEFLGTPWEQPDVYRANSASNAITSMRTPTLIIHGQRDYRVDLSDGLQMYTALRRQGTAARFLTYADQGHHIKDPRAWQLMWKEIFSWLGRYIQ